MTNQPLNSSEKNKVFIFALLLAPSIVFLGGVIPALFLGFGLFMMKKDEDFSHIEAAVRNFKGYMLLVGIVCAFLAVYWGYEHKALYDYIYPNANHSWLQLVGVDAMLQMIFAVVAFSYFVLVHVLFLSPLRSHSEWVETNGLFSSKPKTPKQSGKDSEVDIIKGEKLKSYSVADELLKWAKLKEDGHISEEQYDDARNKLLQRN